MATVAKATVEFTPLRGGKLKWEGSAFIPRLYKFPNAIQRMDAELESILNYTAEDGTQYQAKFLPWIWANSPQPDSNRRKKVGVFAEVKEGWVERSSSAWDLRIGEQPTR